MRKIMKEEINTYREDGVVCLRQAFNQEWVELLREAAEESIQDPGELHAELSEEKKRKGPLLS